MITAVRSDISDAGFRVNISALQEGVNFDQNNIVGVKMYNSEDLASLGETSIDEEPQT